MDAIYDGNPIEQQYSPAHEGIPNGVPADAYGGYNYKPRINPDGPFPTVSTWECYSHWLTVYIEAGKSYTTNVGVELTDFFSWGYDFSQNIWVLLNNTFDYGTWYLENFYNDGNGYIPNTIRFSLDKKDYQCKMSLETSGRCFHPFSTIIKIRDKAGIWNNGQPHIITQCKFRLIKWDENGIDNRANTSILVNSGGDWWRYTSDTWQPDWSTNRDIAVGKFLKATNEWRTAYMTNLPKSWSYGFPSSSTTTVSVTGLTLNKNMLSLPLHSSQTLKATISPTNATNKSVMWSSSNTSVAIVSNTGVVTALTRGTCTITCATIDGYKTASCKITVRN